MSYINIAINKNRILNHFKLIKRKMILLDSSATNRELLCKAGHIELQLTDKCILNCPNCHFREIGECEFSFEWLDNIVNFIKPKAITIAGGGEPTIYPRFNDAVLKLAKIPRVKLGLITNGVIVPKGLWVKYITWVRVSVYSIEKGKYAGRKPELFDKVINNVQWYLRNTSIPNIGIHFLFYSSNISNVVSFAKYIYSRFKEDKQNFSKIHIQFKPAFIIARPTQLTPAIHEENIKLLPDCNQIRIVLAEFKKEFHNDLNFKVFLEKQSNYQLFHRLSKGYLNKLIEITSKNKMPISKANNCYVCLSYQLISPDGYIYPCLTLAEHRLHKFSACHISELPNCYSKEINKFYMASTECCNKLFCRNWDQNEIVKKYLKKPLKINIPKDNFF